MDEEQSALPVKLFVLADRFGAACTINVTCTVKEPEPIVKVTLPVAVTVGSITLPAGECTIQALQSDGNGSVLLLRASNGMNVEVIANRINEARTANETHITLLTDGGTHHIDKVWLAGQQTGYELLAAK